jgi:hypothetical protein
MSKIRKAIVAGLGAGVSALGTALAGGAKLDAQTLGAAAGLALATAWAVWRAPNS